MTSTRQLASNLATYIATEKWVPDGVNVPMVYLDAITQNIDIGDRPIVIVSTKNTTGLWRSTPEHHIEVVLGVNSSAFHANAAAPVETPEGVLVFGSGALLDELTNLLVNTIKNAVPGANLSDLQIEYALDTLPIQFATISVTFKEEVAYGDGYN